MCICARKLIFGRGHIYIREFGEVGALYVCVCVCGGIVIICRSEDDDNDDDDGGGNSGSGEAGLKFKCRPQGVKAHVAPTCVV